MAYSTVRNLINRAGEFSLAHKRALREAFTQVYADKADGGEITTGPGTGITTGTGTIAEWHIVRSGGVVKSELYIDLTGLNSSAAGDIIGVNAAANCHWGQVLTADHGTLFAGELLCIETPTTGEPDIDVYSATEATGTEDAAVGDLVEVAALDAAIDWTIGTRLPFSALPASGKYLYLVGSGGGTGATYDAGRFIMTLWGTV